MTRLIEHSKKSLSCRPQVIPANVTLNVENNIADKQINPSLLPNVNVDEFLTETQRDNKKEDKKNLIIPTVAASGILLSGIFTNLKFQKLGFLSVLLGGAAFLISLSNNKRNNVSEVKTLNNREELAASWHTKLDDIVEHGKKSSTPIIADVKDGFITSLNNFKVSGNYPQNECLSNTTQKSTINKEYNTNTLNESSLNKLNIKDIIFNSSFDNVIKQVDFEPYRKTEKTPPHGLPLVISRKEFISRLNKEAAVDDNIFDKLNISPINDENGELIGFDGIIKIPKDKSEFSRYVREFLSANKVVTEHPQFNDLINKIIQVMPEYICIVGKKQHKTHDFTLDMHILQALKKAIESDWYNELSEEGKNVLKMSILMHDISKAEFRTDKTHPQKSAEYAKEILEHFDLDKTTKSRIINMIYNHHWFADYNKSTDKNRALDIANKFKYSDDFKIARIMAYADISSVNPKFIDKYLGGLNPAYEEISKILDFSVSSNNVPISNSHNIFQPPTPIHMVQDNATSKSLPDIKEKNIWEKEDQAKFLTALKKNRADLNDYQCQKILNDIVNVSQKLPHPENFSASSFLAATIQNRGFCFAERFIQNANTLGVIAEYLESTPEMANKKFVMEKIKSKRMCERILNHAMQQHDNKFISKLLNSLNENTLRLVFNDGKSLFTFRQNLFDSNFTKLEEQIRFFNQLGNYLANTKLGKLNIQNLLNSEQVSEKTPELLRFFDKKIDYTKASEFLKKIANERIELSGEEVALLINFLSLVDTPKMLEELKGNKKNLNKLTKNNISAFLSGLSPKQLNNLNKKFHILSEFIDENTLVHTCCQFIPKNIEELDNLRTCLAEQCGGGKKLTSLETATFLNNIVQFLDMPINNTSFKQYIQKLLPHVKLDLNTIQSIASRLKTNEKYLTLSQIEQQAIFISILLQNIESDNPENIFSTGILSRLNLPSKQNNLTKNLLFAKNWTNIKENSNKFLYTAFQINNTRVFDMLKIIEEAKGKDLNTLAPVIKKYQNVINNIQKTQVLDWSSNVPNSSELIKLNKNLQRTEDGVLLVELTPNSKINGIGEYESLCLMTHGCDTKGMVNILHSLDAGNDIVSSTSLVTPSATKLFREAGLIFDTEISNYIMGYYRDCGTGRYRSMEYSLSHYLNNMPYLRNYLSDLLKTTNKLTEEDYKKFNDFLMNNPQMDIPSLRKCIFEKQNGTKTTIGEIWDYTMSQLVNSPNLRSNGRAYNEFLLNILGAKCSALFFCEDGPSKLDYDGFVKKYPLMHKYAKENDIPILVFKNINEELIISEYFTSIYTPQQKSLLKKYLDDTKFYSKSIPNNLNLQELKILNSMNAATNGIAQDLIAFKTLVDRTQLVKTIHFYNELGIFSQELCSDRQLQVDILRELDIPISQKEIIKNNIKSRNLTNLPKNISVAKILQLAMIDEISWEYKVVERGLLDKHIVTAEDIGKILLSSRLNEDCWTRIQKDKDLEFLSKYVIDEKSFELFQDIFEIEDKGLEYLKSQGILENIKSSLKKAKFDDLLQLHNRVKQISINFDKIDMLDKGMYLVAKERELLECNYTPKQIIELVKIPKQIWESRIKSQKLLGQISFEDIIRYCNVEEEIFQKIINRNLFTTKLDYKNTIILAQLPLDIFKTTMNIIKKVPAIKRAEDAIVLSQITQIDFSSKLANLSDTKKLEEMISSIVHKHIENNSLSIDDQFLLLDTIFNYRGISFSKTIETIVQNLNTNIYINLDTQDFINKLNQLKSIDVKDSTKIKTQVKNIYKNLGEQVEDKDLEIVVRSIQRLKYAENQDSKKYIKEFDKLSDKEKEIIYLAVIMKNITGKLHVKARKAEILASKLNIRSYDANNLSILLRNSDWLSKIVSTTQDKFIFEIKSPHRLKLLSILSKVDSDDYESIDKFTKYYEEKITNFYKNSIAIRGIDLPNMQKIQNKDKISGLQCQKDGNMVIRLDNKTDFQALGFPKDVNANNLVLFVHAVDNPAQFQTLVAMKYTNNDAIFSVTGITAGLSDTYKPCGVILNTDIYDCILGYCYNFRSGKGKNTDNFVNDFIHQNSIFHKQYEYFPKIFKEVNGLNDEDYLKFLKLLENNPECETFVLKDGSKINIKQMYENTYAKLFDDTIEKRNTYNRGYNEFLFKSMRVSGIFFQESNFDSYDGFAKVHPEMVNYAKANNLPIFMLPNKTV